MLDESEITPTHDTWVARSKDVKSYLHFDGKVGKAELERLANNQAAVAAHAFMPLIRFKERWVKFRKGGRKVLKTRPIRYCSRRDAAIFAKYRASFSVHYEDYLVRKGIEKIPIAYRKIPKITGGNKSNIEFAKDVFDACRELGNCDVTVVDISSFFEKIDHSILRKNLVKVLGKELGPDEQAVFNAVTNYSVVDIKPLFERLGLFKKIGGAGRFRRFRKIDLIQLKKHKRIFDRGQFKDLVCGGDPKLPSLIQKHSGSCGIPQGTPISDILANIYLIDFDLQLARWVRKRGGHAFRYSDDVIVILPRNISVPFDTGKVYLKSLITKCGPELKIKDEKVAVGRFIRHETGQIYTHLFGKSSQNGLEYLGFQFDGVAVQIRNSTLSNAWRKLHKRAHGWAKRRVRRFRNKGDAWLLAAPLEDKATEILRTLSVPQSGEASVKDWTFNSYVKRAELAFKEYDNRFASQIKKYKKRTHSILEEALVEAIERHGKETFIKHGGVL